MKYKDALKTYIIQIPKPTIDLVQSVFGKLVSEKYQECNWSKMDVSYYNYIQIDRADDLRRENHGYWGGHNRDSFATSPIIAYKFAPVDSWGEYVHSEIISVLLLSEQKLLYSIYRGHI